MKNINDFLEKAKNKYEGYYSYKVDSFNGMKKKMIIICPIHGEYKQTPKNHLLCKFGCPLCANANKKKKTVFTDRERIGKKTITNAGFHIVCVKYRKSNDITVLFDDGTKVDTTWDYFQKGSVDHPKYKNYRKSDAEKYIGMTAYSTFGELMAIVAARNWSDIDVQFPDGSIAMHKRLDAFKKGEIKRPTQTTDEIFLYHKSKRLGEKRLQNNGMTATVIEYHKTYIVVEFENGKRRRCTYSCFIKGVVVPSEKHNVHDISRIGEKRTLQDGHVIEIIEYKSSQKIVISIDGDKRKNTNYRWFKETTYIDADSQHQNMGTSIVKREQKKKIGEVNYNIYTGEKMTITKYNGHNEITVRFEDGTIVNNIRYQNFKTGLVMNPNRPNRNQVSLNEYAILYYLRNYGFIHAKRGSLKECGLGKKEIDIFNPSYKIGIEYDGWMHKKTRDIAKNDACRENGIKLYRIQESQAPVLDDPDCYRLVDDRPLSDDLLRTMNNIISDINSITGLAIKPVNKFNKNKIKSEFYEYTYTVNDIVGNSRKLNNGDIITVTRYGGCRDIDFSLSNGKIIKHKSLQAFKEYSWTNQIDYNKAYWEGLTKTINGRKFTIKTYYTCTKMLVLCEDGFEKLITKNNWDKGKISHKDDVKLSQKRGIIKDRTGETKKSVIGIDMTITEYIGCNDMTVTFSDGRIARHVKYQAFDSGHVTPDGTNIVSEKLRLQRIGEKYQVKNGKVYTIIDYVSSAKTLIQDECGNIKTCSYYDLKRGKVA